jgi:putative lipoprotein
MKINVERRAPLRALVLAMAVACALAAGSARAQTADPDPWFGKDKALHFAGSVGLASVIYASAATELDARWPPLVIAGGATIAIGGGKELFDMGGRGDPSWRDFTWDVIGTIVGLGLAWGIDLLVRGVSDRHPLFGAPHEAAP